MSKADRHRGRIRDHPRELGEIASDPTSLRTLIRANAELLVGLYEDIRVSFRQVRTNADAFASWKQACGGFHESYDALAFPGGLERSLERLEQGDPGAIEAAVAFLEVDPWFHRSGYIKETLNRRLKRVPLSRQQQVRLQAVIESRILGKDTREFRTYCGLAAVVADDAFIRGVSELVRSEDRRIARHARWVLETIANVEGSGRSLQA